MLVGCGADTSKDAETCGTKARGETCAETAECVCDLTCFEGKCGLVFGPAATDPPKAAKEECPNQPGVFSVCSELPGIGAFPPPGWDPKEPGAKGCDASAAGPCRTTSSARCEERTDPAGTRWHCTCDKDMPNAGLEFEVYADKCCDSRDWFGEACGRISAD